MEKNTSDVLIFGAGPAGLAGGLKLAKNGKKVTIIEKEKQVGGLSKTIKHDGNHFDLGGHRFFTKSKEVNDLWQEMLGSDFLTRPRLSRMYYRNKFFAYPVKPLNAFWGLGPIESLRILFSYLHVKLFSRRPDKSFEDWITNRFGRRLFHHFFKAYTEKLWGIPCAHIQAEWAAQRIKGLSLTSTIAAAIFPKKEKIKTLIDKFKYPKLGPGMMYEKMAEHIETNSGKILKETEVVTLYHDGQTISSVEVKRGNGEIVRLQADHFLSSMPINHLVERFSPPAPPEIMDAARNLSYRSLITISLILDCPHTFPDNWIYIHSPEVKMGRIQNFKNWSLHMVKDLKTTALGLEYFCSEDDDLWTTSDEELIKLGLEELEKLKLGKKKQFIDGFVSRVPKAYPVYDRDYRNNLETIKKFLSDFGNLQPIGRYGMFKYNNMDHSILTGIYAAENILSGKKHDIWSINADQEYHETKSK